MCIPYTAGLACVDGAGTDLNSENGDVWGNVNGDGSTGPAGQNSWLAGLRAVWARTAWVWVCLRVLVSFAVC